MSSLTATNAIRTAGEKLSAPSAFAECVKRTIGKWQATATRHPGLAIASILLWTSLVAVCDFLTGDEIPLMVFFVPAIIATCWMQNIGAGVVLSLVCSCFWLVDDMLLIERSPAINHKYWLAMVHFIFFAVIAAMTWRLRLAQERERALARTDALTGLANRKAFLEAIDVEIARAQRSGAPLAIAYLDCDNFKEVNDSLGHATGDALLLAVAHTAAAHIRPTDMFARLGGDEFACLLGGANEQQANEIMQRVKKNLDERMQQDAWPVTFSIGVAVFPSAPHTADELIGAADQLMYEVKLSEKDGIRLQEFEAGSTVPRARPIGLYTFLLAAFSLGSDGG